MSNLYNCHAHVFNLDCAPRQFLDAYTGRRLGRLLRTALQIPKVTPLLVQLINRLGKNFRLPLLQRYAALLDIGSGVSQVTVFEQQLVPNYPAGTRFVVLALDMDYMGAGRPQLNYESQLWQLLEVRKRHPNTCLPFLCVDPRRGNGAQNLAFVEKWVKRGFVGLKLYPSLGFFPFDERLDEVYTYAQVHQLPVLTHCSRGGIYYQGELPSHLRWPVLPPALLPQLRQAGLTNKLGDNPFPLPVNDSKFRNDEFSDLLLEPRLYDLVLARYPELKLCLAHYGGGDEIAAEITNPSTTTAPTNWYAGVRWLMRKYPNVYTDIAFTLAESAVFRKQPKYTLFKTLAADLDPVANAAAHPYHERLLFGTDFFLVSRLQPENTLAGDFMKYLLQHPGSDSLAWQRLATDNPVRFLHSDFYTPVERLGQQPSRRRYHSTIEPGLTPLFMNDTALTPPPYQVAKKTYRHVQGNILKGHGRDYAAFMFLHFGTSSKPLDINDIRTWLASLLSSQLDSAESIRITNFEKQLTDTENFKQFGIPGELFATILFTAAGLKLLEVPEENYTAPSQVAGEAAENVFVKGMMGSAMKLADPAVAEWEEPWQQAGSIHALLLLADDNLDLLKRVVNKAYQKLQEHQTLVVLEWGNVLRDTNGAGIEHFGYADGVSQPVYLKEDMPNEQPQNAKGHDLWEDVDRWNPALQQGVPAAAQPAPVNYTDELMTPEKLVLVPDLLVGREDEAVNAGCWGSFFVFRKLQQEVKGFKEAEEKLARRLSLAPDDVERAGAMLIGRFEDGTPVAERGSDGLITPIANNFNYLHDPQGSRCPFHAHIRKVNPRGEAPSADHEPLRRLTRRGIPFGDQAEALKDGGDPVGLLFMCYQRNIAQQFEFVQNRWANNREFPNAKAGLDPIIGQSKDPRPKQPFNYTYGAPGCRQAQFEQFVHLKGGGYFYAPSMLGLRKLAGLPVA